MPGAYSRMHAQLTNQHVQDKGLPINVSFYPYTFYTRNVMYKK
jgi:hypothetical protein